MFLLSSLLSVSQSKVFRPKGVATAADGFKLALIDLEKQLAGQDAKIVHILHDEIIVEAKEEIAADVAGKVKYCMEGTFAGILPEVPFVVEPEIRGTWGDS